MLRFVPIKTDDQLDLQAIHRVRDRLISRRTAVINQLRAFLLERGMVFAQKPAKLKAAMADILENAEADLTPLMRNLIDTLWGEWKLVEQQIEELNDELERISASDAGCTRIRKIPGIGPVVATAIVAAIGNGAAFRKGREFAAWLGIVPRQYSTGGKAKLLGISKRGNVYLRKILIHGARAAVLRIKRDRAPIGAWLDALDHRTPKNSLWSLWRTSSHVSHGLCSPAATSTDLSPHSAAEKSACGLEALTRSHFPARSRRQAYPPKSAQESKDERTVTTACPQPGTENGLQRPTDLEGQTRAQLIMARRADLHQKAEYICADLSLDQTSPCSPAADHTFSLLIQQPKTLGSELLFQGA